MRAYTNARTRARALMLAGRASSLSCLLAGARTAIVMAVVTSKPAPALDAFQRRLFPDPEGVGRRQQAGAGPEQLLARAGPVWLRLPGRADPPPPWGMGGGIQRKRAA